MKKPCLACRLKKRITFQNIVETPNTVTGGMTQTYNNWRSVFAEVLPIKGGEYLLNKQVGEKPTHKITVRYAPDLRKDLFINLTQDGGRPDRRFRIIDTTNVDELNAELLILAKEIGNENAY
jgi:SPP1 family predicted phage head-tail adaptor